jgi:hypothetical protein
MRRIGLFALLFCIALPAFAARPLSIQDLRNLLHRFAHEKDASLAARIQGIELSEQLTPAALAGINVELNPGKKTAEALSLLSDQSEFLDPPADELPQKPTPDDETAKSILASAVKYAASTLHGMPNFMATRRSSSFDDSPTNVVQADGFAMASSELHSTGTVVRQIAFRGGKELSSTLENADASSAGKGRNALQSEGEFGPVLGVILRDLPAGSTHWSHWEKLPTGIAAVFKYEVPKPASHYRLSVCCRFGGRYELDDMVMSRVPAYHGKLYVDPDTGTLLRLTLQADLGRSDPVKHGDMMIDYAPVKLGSLTYFCPARSIAILQAYVAISGGNEDMVKHLNRITFSDYRRFGSEMRIVP